MANAERKLTVAPSPGAPDNMAAARAKAYTPEANAKRAASRAVTMARKKREAGRKARAEGDARRSALTKRPGKRKAARAAAASTATAPHPGHTPEAEAKRVATRLANAAAKKRKRNGNGHAMSFPLEAIPDRMPPTPPRVHGANGARPRVDREARLILAAGVIQLLQTILGD